MVSTVTIMVDARRLLCPLPVIRAQEAINPLSKGEHHVTIIFTDPSALKDIPAWARTQGHQVMSMQTQDNEHAITLLIHVA